MNPSSQAGVFQLLLAMQTLANGLDTCGRGGCMSTSSNSLLQRSSEVTGKIVDDHPTTQIQPTLIQAKIQSPWSFDYTAFGESMSMTTMVKIGGAAAATGGTLAAFVGSEVRGVSSTTMSPPFGPYAFQAMYPIMIYADGGSETISFKFSSADGLEYELGETMTFEVNGDEGSYVAPYILTDKWSFDVASFEMSAFSDTMTLSVFVDTPGTKALGAFVGGQLRGVQAPSVPPFGTYAGKKIYQITIYANAGGDTVTFKALKDDYTVVSLAETKTFVVNGNEGNVVAPLVFTAPSPTPAPTPELRASASEPVVEATSLRRGPVTMTSTTSNTVASGGEQQRRLRVAFAVFVTDIGSPAWADALAVLAFALKKAVKKSRHEVSSIVLGPTRLPEDKIKDLKAFGFDEVVKKPVPVPAKDVKLKFAREHMERVQGQDPRFRFEMAEETVKYWGIALMNYDRVLVIDADVLVMDPMDELMELAQDFIGVYDHGLDGPSSTAPPTQGGFLLFRPNLTDFEAVKDLTREGDWNGAGWKRSGIGFCYGGVGPDGLLPYYYNKDVIPKIKKITKAKLPENIDDEPIKGSRWKAVDRPIYDVVINERLRNDMSHAQSEEQRKEAIAMVKSVHFTGECIKPWSCFTAQPGRWLCKGLLDIWWQLRAELEKERGLPPSEKRCKGGRYVPLGRT